MSALLALFDDVVGRALPPGLPEGQVRVELIGPDAVRLDLDLRAGGCALGAEGEPALTVWLSGPQLARIAQGETEDLRCAGDRALLRSLAAALEPAKSALDVRFSR